MVCCRLLLGISRESLDNLLPPCHSVCGNAKSVCMDYLPILRDRLTQPLIHNKQGEGVTQVMELMDSYDLLKDDYDAILDLTSWPGGKDVRSLIETKV